MSKKHFQALAAEIAKIEDLKARVSAAMAVGAVALKDNARFDYPRFLAACNAL